MYRIDDWKQRLARGDSDAFAELYDRCADRVHHYLTVRLGCHDEASDVLQETFLRLTRYRQKLASVDRPEAYVFIVARNESSRRVRRRNRMGPVARPLELFEESCADDPAARERAEWVVELLGRLPRTQREIVELKIYAGLTLAEAARVMGIPQGTIASRYRTALKRMREWMAREAY